MSEQSGQALSLTSANVLKMTINPQFSFGEVVKSISALKKQVEDVWEREMDQISAAGKTWLGLVNSEKYHDCLISTVYSPNFCFSEKRQDRSSC